jgi:transposase-like protein
MAARLSRKRLPRYSLEFKLGAVKLTEVPGVEVLLSRWRQEAREGRLRGFVARPRVVKVKVRVPAVRKMAIRRHALPDREGAANARCWPNAHRRCADGGCDAVTGSRRLCLEGRAG